jgi:DNA-binding NtrC family response regulator
MQAPPAEDCRYGLIGQSPQIAKVRRLIEQLSGNDAPVLIHGETGTGKEVVARAIFNANPRGQFVPIDCAGLSPTLIESELFGHARGAFTGAVEPRKGLVEIADGGTAFFDEIGELPLDLQPKLLRLIQEREFRPVGSNKWHKVRTRIIAATHRDLRRQIADGRFRQDLFYRLNVAKIAIPPLRERREDIPLLIEHFLGRQARDVRVSPELIDHLKALPWDGNIRELKNCIERMLAMSGDAVLRIEHLASYSQVPDGVSFMPVMGFEEIVPLVELERRAILNAVAVTGDKDEAARRLGIGRTTLFRKLKEYGTD